MPKAFGAKEAESIKEFLLKKPMKANFFKSHSISIALILALLIIDVGIYFANNFPFGLHVRQNRELPDFSLASEVLAARFDYLSGQKTNTCAGDKNYVAKLSAGGTKLQGACCSPMDFYSYQEQVEGLQKYSGYEIIPQDPYDVPAA